MKTNEITVALCFLLLLAVGVPANANSATSLDPLTLPYFNCSMPVIPLSAGPATGEAATLSFSQASMDINEVVAGGINTDLRSLVTAKSLSDNQAGLSHPNLSISSDLGGLNIQPQTPMVPEPNEVSLLLAGLAAIGMFVRLSPRKV
jgi:hypothetical protein